MGLIPRVRLPAHPPPPLLFEVYVQATPEPIVPGDHTLGVYRAERVQQFVLVRDVYILLTSVSQLALERYSCGDGVGLADVSTQRALDDFGSVEFLVVQVYRREMDQDKLPEDEMHVARGLMENLRARSAFRVTK